VALAHDIAHETACLDGVPVRVGYDHERWPWCGLSTSEHEVPGDDSPVYQATHVAWPDSPAVPTAEAKAVGLRTAKLRKSSGSGDARRSAASVLSQSW
jgi:hypothetical protein